MLDFIDGILVWGLLSEEGLMSTIYVGEKYTRNDQIGAKPLDKRNLPYQYGQL